MMTKAQAARLARDWSAIAGEAVEVEQIGGAIYGWMSELGSLRLLRKFRDTKAADCGYSDNLGRFYFRIELPC